MTKVPQIDDDPRMGGGVQRYHTWPTIQRQTNAEHQWNVTRILLAIWPEAPREVVLRTLFHDTGEVASGDIPFPVKRDSPVLKREMDRIEESAVLSMAIPWGLPAPQNCRNSGDPDQHPLAIKLADIMEMWEFGSQEIMMGNQLALFIVQRTERAIMKMLGHADTALRERAEWYMSRRVQAWGLTTRLSFADQTRSA